MSQQPLNFYDHIIVAFSGGKDSLAVLLRTLEVGVDRSKIELWHHDVDSGGEFMDWPVTTDYVRKVGAALDLPVYFSARAGGFRAEMLRKDQPTGEVAFQIPGGEWRRAGGKGPLGTRRKFPQQSASLTTRWCSAYLKIDVCSAAIRNQDRFKGKRTVVLTGERAEESAARAKYKIFEAHRASSTERRVDHIRPILHYTSAQVWKLIERHRIHPHPAYYLGWGRVSCAACIFGSKNQWASLNALAPAMVERIAQYEDEFGHTINRKKTVRELVAEGVPYQSITDRWAKLAMSKDFTPEVIMEPWEPPAGMHGENTGPI